MFEVSIRCICVCVHEDGLFRSIYAQGAKSANMGRENMRGGDTCTQTHILLHTHTHKLTHTWTTAYIYLPEMSAHYEPPEKIHPVCVYPRMARKCGMYALS